MNIYERQHKLNLYIPNSVVVLGVGGVGSWVALNLALIGVPRIILIDSDKVEDTNLNRTPFKLEHIGMYKVDALTELILERRDNVEVIPITIDIRQEINSDIPNDIRNMMLQSQYVVDCRDNLEDNWLMDKNGIVYIKAGYDGHNITLHFNFKKGMVQGDLGRRRYSITPSYLVPPQFLANLITQYIVMRRLYNNKTYLLSIDLGVFIWDIDKFMRWLYEQEKKETKEEYNEE